MVAADRRCQGRLTPGRVVPERSSRERRGEGPPAGTAHGRGGGGARQRERSRRTRAPRGGVPARVRAGAGPRRPSPWRRRTENPSPPAIAGRLSCTQQTTSCDPENGQQHSPLQGKGECHGVEGSRVRREFTISGEGPRGRTCKAGKSSQGVATTQRRAVCPSRVRRGPYSSGLRSRKTPQEARAACNASRSNAAVRTASPSRPASATFSPVGPAMKEEP